MRILLGFMTLLLLASCSPYDASKPRPDYSYVYRCDSKAACYDAATIKCKPAGKNKKPTNMSLKTVHDRKEVSGLLGGSIYRSYYEARFECK
ncbi:MAG: hypothetical protein ACK5MJ_08735 [Alphaproteobacteria bacterium]